MRGRKRRVPAQAVGAGEEQTKPAEGAVEQQMLAPLSATQKILILEGRHRLHAYQNRTHFAPLIFENNVSSASSVARTRLARCSRC